MDDDVDSRPDNESIESYENKQAIRQKPSAPTNNKQKMPWKCTQSHVV